MLHYREFPVRTALIFILYAFPLAYCFYVITGLLSNTLFSLTPLEHQGLLGYGALAAVCTLIPIGLIADRVKRVDPLMILFAIIPPLIGLLTIMPDLEIDPTVMQLEVVISSFIGLVALLLLWDLRVGQSIVARYRGRTSALFLCVAILSSRIYSYIDLGNMILIEQSTLFVPALFGLIPIIIAVLLRPWKEPRVALAASGSVSRYFIPIMLIMAAHILWFNVTKLTLQDYFATNPDYQSLSQFINIGLNEIIILCIGIAFAGAMADIRGRKPTFSFVLLLMGLLTIFGSALYNGYFLDPTLTVLLITLLGAERFVEGFLLGIGLLLIWSELGSARTKGIRLSLVWFFFLGYMTLFWAVDLGVTIFGVHFSFPSVLLAIGGQFAILLSLVALYLIGPLPTILGRELEVEELDLNFDEKQVKKTVDAFVGSDDFDSIRSQLDIIDAGAEISDSEMSEILGEDFKTKLPLRSIPGVGDTLEKKLVDAGYESAAQLAGETAQRLSQRVEGLTVLRAEKILKDARSVVKKKMKNKKK